MELLGMQTAGTPALWAGFLAIVLGLLALDLGIFNRRPHEVSLREAAGWSVVWVALSAAFGVFVTFYLGPQMGLEFATGYLIEKALAVDNVFVFVVIFGAFAIPAKYQHRVLFWGVLGALVMRALFVFAGGALLAHFHWTMYLFGGILVLTGIKLLLSRNGDPDPDGGVIVRNVRRFFPVSKEDHGARFFAIENGRRVVTPLMLALVAVEISDVVFAVDSIPAIFAITQDPFVVLTSNIFAILGLRSMYFLLAGVVHKFSHLQIGLAGVLLFVGAKMLAADFVKVPIVVSLSVIALLIGGSVVTSLIAARKKEAAQGGIAPHASGPHQPAA